MTVTLGHYTLEQYERYLPRITGNCNRNCISRIKSWLLRRGQNISTLFNRLVGGNRAFVTSHRLKTTFINDYAQVSTTNKESLLRITTLFHHSICPGQTEIREQFEAWERMQQMQQEHDRLYQEALLPDTISPSLVGFLHGEMLGAATWLATRLVFAYSYDPYYKQIVDKPPFFSEERWKQILIFRRHLDGRFADKAAAAVSLQNFLQRDENIILFGVNKTLSDVLEAKFLLKNAAFGGLFFAMKNSGEKALQEGVLSQSHIRDALVRRLKGIVSQRGGSEKIKLAYEERERQLEIEARTALINFCKGHDRFV